MRLVLSPRKRPPPRRKNRFKKIEGTSKKSILENIELEMKKSFLEMLSKKDATQLMILRQKRKFSARPRDSHLFSLLFLAVLSFSLSAQIAEGELQAQNRFLAGIQAFNRSQYSRSISSFQEALELDVENALYRTWLVRAYYYAGFVDSALREIDYLKEEGKESPVLTKMYETLRSRRQVSLLEEEEGEWFSVLKIPNTVTTGAREISLNRIQYPMGISVSNDGKNRIYISSLGTGRVIGVDNDGYIRDEFSNFSKPFGTVAFGSDLLVSDFQANGVRLINPFGLSKLEFGLNSTPEQRLNGPQYMARSPLEKGDIYLSDWGNKRIVSYRSDGTFRLAFDNSQNKGDQLAGPSGLAVTREGIYVADSIQKKIYLFDSFGNLIQKSLTTGLEKPEGITYSPSNNSLYIADKNQIKRLKLKEQALSVIYTSPTPNSLFSGIALDDNNRLWVSDYTQNKVLNLARISTLKSGLWISILDVDTTRYPSVFVKISVEDSLGTPFVGLSDRNFILLDQGRSVPAEISYSYSESRESDIIIAYDTIPENIVKRDLIREYLRTLVQALSPQDSFQIAEWGEDGAYFIPLSIASLDANFAREALQDIGEMGIMGENLRASVDRIISSSKKKSLYYLYSRSLGSEELFVPYGLNILADYLKNNEVVFNLVNMGDVPVDEEWQFLVNYTGGTILKSNDPLFVSNLQESVLLRKRASSSRYQLSFQAPSLTASTGLYLPLAVEAYIRGGSGRDESGYVINTVSR